MKQGIWRILSPFVYSLREPVLTRAVGLVLESPRAVFVRGGVPAACAKNSCASIQGLFSLTAGSCLCVAYLQPCRANRTAGAKVDERMVRRKLMFARHE